MPLLFVMQEAYGVAKAVRAAKSAKPTTTAAAKVDNVDVRRWNIFMMVSEFACLLAVQLSGSVGRNRLAKS